jgi:uncharacterized protein YggU (UPF0235/DUF167 family)
MIQFYVQLIPKSSQNRVEGWISTPQQKKILKVKVRTVPEKGKANKALINLLSKELKVTKSNIQILRGLTSSIKLLKVEEVIEGHLEL